MAFISARVTSVLCTLPIDVSDLVACRTYMYDIIVLVLHACGRLVLIARTPLIKCQDVSLSLLILTWYDYCIMAQSPSVSAFAHLPEQGGV